MKKMFLLKALFFFVISFFMFAFGRMAQLRSPFPVMPESEVLMEDVENVPKYYIEPEMDVEAAIPTKDRLKRGWRDLKEQIEKRAKFTSTQTKEISRKLIEKAKKLKEKTKVGAKDIGERLSSADVQQLIDFKKAYPKVSAAVAAPSVASGAGGAALAAVGTLFS